VWFDDAVTVAIIMMVKPPFLHQAVLEVMRLAQAAAGDGGAVGVVAVTGKSIVRVVVSQPCGNRRQHPSELLAVAHIVVLAGQRAVPVRVASNGFVSADRRRRLRGPRAS